VVILVMAAITAVAAQFSTFKMPLAFGINIPDNEKYRVIVSYKTNVPLATRENIAKRAEQLQSDRKAVTSRIKTSNHLDVIDSFENLPIMIVETDMEGLRELARDPSVENVAVDRTLEIFNSSFEAIGCQFNGVTACSDGSLNYAGDADGSNGYEVVIIDTGMRSTHIALSGKISAEACFSINGTDSYGNTITSMCPGGATSSTAAGSSEECVISGCGHGTKVAGAAAMLSSQVSGNKISGSAPNAKLIPIRVVSQNTFTGSTNQCDGADTTCALLYLSSIYAAMNHVITLSATHDRIASVNISAGANAYSSVSECQSFSAGDYNNFNNAATNLKNLGIATVVASGNSGNNANQGKIAFPACAESAIAVGAADAYGDAMAYYSQNGTLVDLIAPGGDSSQVKSMMLPSSSGDSLFSGVQGTSFAAPTVAGIYATLRSKYPLATVDQLTNLLKTTGRSMIDSRTGYGSLNKPFVQVQQALKANLTELTTTYTLSGTNIVAARDATLATLKTKFSTPYGYTIMQNSNTLYKSGLTPYGANIAGNGFASDASTTKLVTGITINLYRYNIGSNEPFKTYYVVINGDTNGDGKIDITDLVQVSRHMANVSPLTGYRLAAGDINKDGRSDITDLVRISQHMAGVREIQ